MDYTYLNCKKDKGLHLKQTKIKCVICFSCCWCKIKTTVLRIDIGLIDHYNLTIIWILSSIWELKCWSQIVKNIYLRYLREIFKPFGWWPREFSTMQLKKNTCKYEKKKLIIDTSKLGKHYHQLDYMCAETLAIQLNRYTSCKCMQHTQISQL